jgi:hypothetical protein
MKKKELVRRDQESLLKLFLSQQKTKYFESDNTSLFTLGYYLRQTLSRSYSQDFLSIYRLHVNVTPLVICRSGN